MTTALLAAPLGWLGRRASGAIAAGVFLGLVLPPLAAWCRPVLVLAILLPFVGALLRSSPAGSRRARGHRPCRPWPGCCWRARCW